MTRVSACLLVLLFSIASNAQSPTCALPEVRGLAIGMTAVKIKKQLPSFVMPAADKYGYARIARDFTLERGRYETYSSDPSPSPPDILMGLDTTGLAQIQVGFFDGRIVLLIFDYKSDAEWLDINEFVQKLSLCLNVPAPSQWTKIATSTLELPCGNSKMRASIVRGGGSRLLLGEVGVNAEIEKRKQAEKDRGRQTFKPQ
jgi:hypothetical protein